MSSKSSSGWAEVWRSVLNSPHSLKTITHLKIQQLRLHIFRFWVQLPKYIKLGTESQIIIISQWQWITTVWPTTSPIFHLKRKWFQPLVLCHKTTGTAGSKKRRPEGRLRCSSWSSHKGGWSCHTFSWPKCRTILLLPKIVYLQLFLPPKS